MSYRESRSVLESHGIDVDAIDAMTYEEMEGAIACSEDEFDVACYQTYLGGMWNEGYFESAEDKGYCWNLIVFCAQRSREINYPANWQTTAPRLEIRRD